MTNVPPDGGDRRRHGAPRSVPEALRSVAEPLRGRASDYDRILERIGDSRVVLIGEASHGTADFYRVRAEITRRLIEEKGFSAVAAEADWPDAFRVNRYVRGQSDDPSGDDALASFQRFPDWMWRNRVVLEFVDWLRAHNDARANGRAPVGFYGLDLYSLYASIEAVVTYLDEVDPEAGARARARYACFDHFDDPQAYGYAAGLGLVEPCEDSAVQQLVELQRERADLAQQDGRSAGDAFFSAEMNARLTRDAERYYRAMFRGRASTWNLRDRHMADTLDALLAHLDAAVGRSKIVVWEHNSHIGDSRATAMSGRGEINVGQLARERHPGQAVLIGLTTHTGTVTAAADWGGPAERRRVRPSLAGSYERVFHDVDLPRFAVDLRGPGDAIRALREPRLQRAIGVIYRPETERLSHYYDVRLAEQFDTVIHLDDTTALEPLEPTSQWQTGEEPATYPFGE